MRHASLASMFDGDGQLLSKRALKVVAMAPAIQHAVGSIGLSHHAALLNVSQRVAEELTKLLQVSVTDVIARGWTTYHELQQYRDPLQYSPNETVTCLLGKHSMDFTDTPTVEVIVAGNPPRRFEVKFKLTLHADLSGVVLTIQNGKVMSAEVGHCDVSASVHLGSTELLRKPLGEFALAESFEIPGGLPI